MMSGRIHHTVNISIIIFMSCAENKFAASRTGELLHYTSFHPPSAGLGGKDSEPSEMRRPDTAVEDRRCHVTVVGVRIIELIMYSLFQIGFAICCSGGIPCFVQCRKQHPRKNRNAGNDYQKLNKGESCGVFSANKLFHFLHNSLLFFCSLSRVNLI